MDCKLCGKTAWYEVPTPRGKTYYCGDHRPEAVAAMAAENAKNDRSRTDGFMAWAK
jgi:hypothetical protein